MQYFNIFFLWLLYYLTQLSAFILAYAVVCVFVQSNYKANKQEYCRVFYSRQSESWQISL